ncbi:MAG TPA: DUF11 domain-containing protein [Thermoanaerobaculia bacterium]|nr:DUF11 domain-containing protein [Thermoanaerobaculia bacterium]
MRRRGVILLAALLLALPWAAHAQIQKSFTAEATLPAAPSAPTVVLYDQTNNASGNGAPVQDFEASFDAYDCDAADDFVITDATGWDVEQVVIVGTQSSGGTPTSVDVTFYADSATFPGAVVCSYPGLIPAGSTTMTVTLPTVCELPQGTFWLGFQVNQNFGGGNGQVFWSNRTTQSGSGGVWRNPLDGFGSGCTSWGRQTTCGVGGGTNPDFLFQILGEVGVVEADLSIQKTGLAPAPGSAEFTIIVTNDGPDAATGVVVTDTFPAELAYVSDDCGGVNGTPWTWSVGNLAATASATCTIQMSVVTAGTVVNTASVSGNEPDNEPDNDSSTATLVVESQQSVLEIPTLGTLGIVALMALLATTALLALRRRRA